MINTLNTASVTWQSDHLGNTVPISNAFDDVYFSYAGGLCESHYVFIEGNNLHERLSKIGDGQTFVVAETGFGTGLNFLALCRLWETLKQNKQLNPGTRLHFISTEKFPLSQDDLCTALSAWQNNNQIQHFIRKLIKQYPLPLVGCHRIHIQDDITLDLWLGDALESFNSLKKTQYVQNQNGPILTSMVDAWFLDGFAPSKNSDLWSDELFYVIKQLSSPNATLATFTAAGFVRRGLQAVGFKMDKRQGFGHKREMLIGTLPTQNKQHNKTPTHVAVVGAGISGLCTAFALAKRGIQVTIFDKNTPPTGASGNPRALFTPKLSPIDQVRDHLSTVAFLYAERFYQALNAHGEIFFQSGVVDFLLPTQKSTDKLKALIKPYPSELIREITSEYSDQNIHTVVPKAGLVHPKNLADSILSHPLISFRQMQINQVKQDETGVILASHDEDIITDKAIIASGYQSHLLHNKLFNPRKIRGQVSWLSIDGDTASKLPSQPIKYDGYCTKFNDGGVNYFLMGASFIRNSTNTDISNEEHRFNIDKFSQALPTLAQHLNLSSAIVSGRTSIRAQTPDYHPIIGQADGNIYTIYGMGSKGFTFSPLCGEVLAGIICGEVLPVSDVLLNKINPNRPRLQTVLSDNK